MNDLLMRYDLITYLEEVTKIFSLKHENKFTYSKSVMSNNKSCVPVQLFMIWDHQMLEVIIT